MDVACQKKLKCSWVVEFHWISDCFALALDTYLFLARLFFGPEKAIQKRPEKHFVDHLVLAKPFPRHCWLVTGGWMVLHWLVMKRIPCSSSVLVFHAFPKLLTTKRFTPLVQPCPSFQKKLVWIFYMKVRYLPGNYSNSPYPTFGNCKSSSTQKYL